MGVPVGTAAAEAETRARFRAIADEEVRRMERHSRRKLKEALKQIDGAVDSTLAAKVPATLRAFLENNARTEAVRRFPQRVYSSDTNHADHPLATLTFCIPSPLV